MKQPHEILIGDNSLLNTLVDEIKIFKDEEWILNISIKFSNFSKKSEYKSLVLLFVNVKEYNFYHNQMFEFYNVESFKFFKKGEDYYLSLDPDNKLNSSSEEDMDYVLSSEVKIILDDDGL